MKIEPKTNYIKPAYAIGASALIAATLFTGCPADKSNKMNVRHKKINETEETELILGGDTQCPTEESTELMIDGDVAYVPDESDETIDTEEFILEGDVAYIPDETDETDEFYLEGGATCAPDDDDLQWEGEEVEG